MYNLLKPPPGMTTGLPMNLKEPHTPSTSRPKHTRKIKTLLKSTEASLSSHMSASQSHDSVMSQKNERILAQIATSMESPKRPANAFMMFCDQYKQSIQNEYMKVGPCL